MVGRSDRDVRVSIECSSTHRSRVVTGGKMMPKGARDFDTLQVRLYTPQSQFLGGRRVRVKHNRVLIVALDLRPFWM